MRLHAIFTKTYLRPKANLFTDNLNPGPCWGLPSYRCCDHKTKNNNTAGYGKWLL